MNLICQPEPLEALFTDVGLTAVSSRSFEISTVFKNFNGYSVSRQAGSRADLASVNEVNPRKDPSASAGPAASICGLAAWGQERVVCYCHEGGNHSVYLNRKSGKVSAVPRIAKSTNFLLRKYQALEQCSTAYVSGRTRAFMRRAFAMDGL